MPYDEKIRLECFQKSQRFRVKMNSGAFLWLKCLTEHSQFKRAGRNCGPKLKYPFTFTTANSTRTMLIHHGWFVFSRGANSARLNCVSWNRVIFREYNSSQSFSATRQRWGCPSWTGYEGKKPRRATGYPCCYWWTENTAQPGGE